MVGAGAGGLVGSNPKPGDLTMVQVGMALLTACWAVLAIWALIALLGQRSKTAATHYEGSVVS